MARNQFMWINEVFFLRPHEIKLTVGLLCVFVQFFFIAVCVSASGFPLLFSDFFGNF